MSIWLASQFNQRYVHVPPTCGMFGFVWVPLSGVGWRVCWVGWVVGWWCWCWWLWCWWWWGGGSRPQQMAHFLKEWFFWQTVFRNGFWCTVILFVLKDFLADWFKFDNWMPGRLSILSRSQEISISEKVRINHHRIHQKISSITKLETHAGIVEGYNDCAAALEANISNHLVNPAKLDSKAQQFF